MGARRRQSLGPATAGHWLRVQHDQRRSPCVQTLLELSRLLPAAVQHPQDIDRALLERYLTWLRPLPLADSTKASHGCSCGRSWRRTGATAGCPPSRPRRRSTQKSCPVGAAPCPASSPSSSWASWSRRRTSPSCACPTEAWPCSSPRPGYVPGTPARSRSTRAAGRQRRLAMPAVRQFEDARRTPATAVDSGRGSDPRPATARPPELSRRVRLAVPVAVRPTAAGALRHVPQGLRRMAAPHRLTRRNRLRHKRHHPRAQAHARNQDDQLGRSRTRHPALARPRQPYEDGHLCPHARHHDPRRV